MANRLNDNSSQISSDPFKLQPLISFLNPIKPNRSSGGCAKEIGGVSGLGVEKTIPMGEKNSIQAGHELDNHVCGVQRRLKAGRKAKWMILAKENGANLLDGGTCLSDSEIRACNLQLLRKSARDEAADIFEMGESMGLLNNVDKSVILDEFADWENRDRVEKDKLVPGEKVIESNAVVNADSLS